MSKSKSEIKDHVVAFRLTDEQFAQLTTKMKSEPVAGISRPGVMARKLVLDFVQDKLSWRRKADRQLSSEVQAAANAAS